MKLLKIIPTPMLNESAKNPINIIIEAAKPDASCDWTDNIPAWILSSQLSVIFAIPDGFLLFSIERTIMNRIMAIMEVVNSIKNPLIKPTKTPKSRLKLRKFACDLNRFSIFDEYRDNIELAIKMKK